MVNLIDHSSEYLLAHPHKCSLSATGSTTLSVHTFCPAPVKRVDAIHCPHGPKSYIMILLVQLWCTMVGQCFKVPWSTGSLGSLDTLSLTHKRPMFCPLTDVLPLTVTPMHVHTLTRHCLNGEQYT